jgi:glycosyltransferase involved in cell wall biosynthesis
MPAVLHLITGLETGGAERMLARLVARMDRVRFPTAVVTMTGPGAIGPAIVAAGVPLDSLDLGRGRPDPRGLLRLIRILRARRPAILQSWLYHADLLALAARLLGFAPHLVWNLRCTESTISPRLRFLLSRASGVPDAVIVNSQYGERLHRAIGYGPRHWMQIPNGFDTAALRPDPEAGRDLRAALGIGPEEPAILFPARYDPMKDHATFVAAAASFAAMRPDARFVLAGAGSGHDNRRLVAEIAANGLAGRTLLLGERADLDRLYPAFDLVTLTSAYGEGFPNVLGEAMACGIPCVATDSGDSAAIIGDTGEIVPTRQPQALAAAWRRMLDRGPEERRAIGLRARDRIVRHYDLDAVVTRYEQLYDDIAATGSDPLRLSRGYLR